MFNPETELEIDETQPGENNLGEMKDDENLKHNHQIQLKDFDEGND